MYPGSGFTKGDVVHHYTRVARAILPHLMGRPLTLKRFPDGVGGAYFYEKNCPHYRPDWLRTQPIWVDRYRDHFDYCVVDDLASLLWLANLANLEMHCALGRADTLDSPAYVVFDLDPGHPAGLLDAAELALVLRGMLGRVGLVSLVKSSGSKGIHVYVPLNTRTSYERTKGFARAIAESLAARLPDRVVASTAKRKRAGRVLVDWGQNDRHRTMVAPYSLRAKDDPALVLDRPGVSTPLRWEEVERAVERQEPKMLVATTEEIGARIERQGDLFVEVEEIAQELPTQVTT